MKPITTNTQNSGRQRPSESRKGSRKARISLLAALFLPAAALLSALVAGCARMGQPDGGWYDETPPQVIGATPADKSVNIKGRKIVINFNEYVKIDNPTENVIVSPPQLEAPEIKGQGKRITVELKDSLKPNTTYTVDFSDAITDNNENNPLGNYTYSFSTGGQIDTMEVSGYVLDARTLEPVKGISVGLYSSFADSVFTKDPMLRVSRTNAEGRFVIKGVANGTYSVYALQDVDGNFAYTQKSEMMAFSADSIVTSSKPDIRQDTIWRDSLRIAAINRVPYTHYLPDDIVLKAFTATLTDRYLIKSERQEANHFTLFYSYGSDSLPELKGLNFNEKDAFLIETTPKRDTITYWIKDTAMVNQDTLRLQLRYEMTDSNGVLRPQTDTLEILSKQPYAKRLKEKNKKLADWEKSKAKAEKRNESFNEPKPGEELGMRVGLSSQTSPDENAIFRFKTPLAEADTGKIHLYSKIDTLWYKARYAFRPRADEPQTYELLAEWRPGTEYSLELDSAAFKDIYGVASVKMKQGFRVRSLDEYGSLFVTLAGMADKNVVCELLDGQDRPVKQVRTKSGTAEFYYLKPALYYLRLTVDENDNGRWDTGDYALGLQPETVYYYPEEVECKAKWDVTITWNVGQTPFYRQKPAKITKQKGDKKRTIKRRNLERAASMGIPLPEKYQVVAPPEKP